MIMKVQTWLGIKSVMLKLHFCTNCSTALPPLEGSAELGRTLLQDYSVCSGGCKLLCTEKFTFSGALFFFPKGVHVL